MGKILEGKVALITGASRGIGKAIALRFAAEGAAIAFTHVTPSAAAEQTEQEIVSMGVKVKKYIADAADYATTEALVSEVAKEFGRIDILVNNAGITRDGLLMRMSEQQWDEVISANLKSAFNFCRACTPLMMRQRSGSIINMSSVVGVHGNAGQCNYSASKAGIIGLTKSIAAELGSRGVRANVIAPGFINTDMTSKLSEELRAEWAKQIPLRRAGEGGDVAGTALFFASDLSAYVTGQVLQVDGGMAM
ncbi:MAG: 3-oxoacyl-[Bacteroidaceae bacterium]|nr:3-oxoacyl-[acyl-carrier-protein] reductase [Bacteroidaceae bacterium]